MFDALVGLDRVAVFVAEPVWIPLVRAVHAVLKDPILFQWISPNRNAKTWWVGAGTDGALSVLLMSPPRARPHVGLDCERP